MQLYQPTITGSLAVSGSVTINGPMTVVSGSLSGTASLATTASYAVVATSASYAASSSFASAFTVAGTLTAQTLVVQTITSSISTITGSTNFGSTGSNTHTFTGSVSITGSLTTTSTGSFARGIIGTRTNPAANYPLEVYGNDARVVVQDNSNNTAGFFMRVVSGSTQVGSATIRTDNTGTFTIFAGGLSESARLIINSVGSVGIGITPASTWGSSTKVVQIGSGSFYNDGFNNTIIATNAYFSGVDNYHINTGPALRYYQEQSNGEHYFQVAPSKVSGSVVSYTSSLYIKNNGNIGVNTLTPTAKLHISGATEAGLRVVVGGTAGPIHFSGDNNITSGSVNAYNGIVAIGRATSNGIGVNPDIAINSSGNVGIGIQSPSSSLHVVGGIRSSSGANYTTMGSDGIYCVTSNLYLDAGAYDMRFYTGNSSKATLTSGGYFRLATAGIQFNGDTADANSLDDYEEGTINITTLTDGVATFTQVDGYRQLSYTKIGNRVYVSGNIYNSSISGTWTNPLRVPLPYTSGGSGDAQYGRFRSAGHAALYNWGTSDNIFKIENSGATYAELVSAGSGGAWGTLTTTAGFTAIVNFSYITA